MSIFPYNRSIAQTTSSLNVPPRLSHMPLSVVERPSMVEFNGTVQAQPLHSSDAFSVEQETHPVMYEQFNNHTSMYNPNVGLRQTTAIYPPNPAFSLHTQIYTPSERTHSYTGDSRQDMNPFPNYRNNFFHQLTNTNFPHQGYPQLGNERQDAREVGRNLHLSLTKQSGMILILFLKCMVFRVNCLLFKVHIASENPFLSANYSQYLFCKKSWVDTVCSTINHGG